MYWLYFCLIILATARNLCASDSKFDQTEIDRGNAYIDKLLQEMLDSGDYDPYNMDESSSGFSKKIVFVNVTGEAKFYNGRIIGLRTLHRSEDCLLSEIDGKLDVKAKLGLGVLKLHYESVISFMNLGKTIEIDGVVNYVEIHMDFSVNASTGQNGELHRLTIGDLKGMKVWISGLGPLNWLVNPLLKMANRVFRGKVQNLLENKVEKYISERLQNFVFPVEERRLLFT